jgi:hypothetical protein
MWFKDKNSFINYTQIIPGFFIIIWIIMSYYVEYDAPKHPDEINGRIYSVSLRSGDAYLTLTEEILLWGSIILASAFIPVLILISSHFWKDNDEK